MSRVRLGLGAELTGNWISSKWGVFRVCICDEYKVSHWWRIAVRSVYLWYLMAVFGSNGLVLFSFVKVCWVVGYE